MKTQQTANQSDPNNKHHGILPFVIIFGGIIGLLILAKILLEILS